MSRRRKERIDRSPPPSPQKVTHLENQMRGLIEAARAPRARRFVTPMQVQSRINATINRELRYVVAGNKKQAPRGSRASVEVSGTPLSRRNALHKSSMLRARLPQQVRDVLLDSERALECSRREARREVMFALHRTGQGGRKNRKARWTANSRISCKKR